MYFWESVWEKWARVSGLTAQRTLLVIDGGKQWPRKSQTVGKVKHFSVEVKAFLAVDLIGD